jgi:hypothetical protein
MSVRKEQEYVLQQAAFRQLQQGTIDRREFLTRSLVAGLGLAGVGAVAKSGSDRPSPQTAR